jgi:2-dehydro-3-deoxygalactonokinase
VDGATLAPRSEKETDEGIGATFSSWRKQARGAEERRSFYYSTIRSNISNMDRGAKTSLAGVPLVISGMASSSIGMVELPYRAMPFATDGSDLSVQTFKAGDDFDRDVAVVSGVRTDDDVMRGEEVQLIGALAGEPRAEGERLFIFPGTHSKHVVVAGGFATAFRTYMTGEFFKLLASQSVLAEMVGPETPWSGAPAAFDEGVREGAAANLLHACFHVRARGLLQPGARAQGYHYLSGLLIGSELRELRQHAYAELVIVAGPSAAARYRRALQILEAPGPISTRDVGKSLLRGHAQIARRLGWLG